MNLNERHSLRKMFLQEKESDVSVEEFQQTIDSIDSLWNSVKDAFRGLEPEAASSRIFVKKHSSTLKELESLLSSLEKESSN